MGQGNFDMNILIDGRSLFYNGMDKLYTMTLVRVSPSNYYIDSMLDEYLTYMTDCTRVFSCIYVKFNFWEKNKFSYVDGKIFTYKDINLLDLVE